MTSVKSSSKGHTARRLIMAPVMLTMVAGLSLNAKVKDERAVPSAGVEGAQIGEPQRGLASPLEGSWVFNIDVLGQGTTFNSLISFTAGGVVVTSASLPGAPFYGAWHKTGSNRFSAAFYAFIPGDTGKGVGLRKVSLILQLNSRNTLTGTAVGADCDLQGENCVQTVEFQNTGKRILPE